VNNLMFPAPTPTPKRLSDPMLKDSLLDTEVIPCTFFRQHGDVRLLTILLHGNASDIGACKETAQLLGIHLHSHVLSPEYPGYGIYPGEPTEESLNTSFEAVYNWVISPNGLNWPTSQLIILGRSIGSGPATHVCQQNIRIAPQKQWCKELISDCGVYNCAPRSCQGPLNDRAIKTGRMSKSALQCYLKAEDIDFPEMATRKELVSLATYHNINVGVDFTEDPFILVKRAALLTMLEKEDIKIPAGTTSRIKLIELARNNNLIPFQHDWGGPLDRPKAALLVLLSAFGSIKHVVQALVGDMASRMILNRFNNFKKIQNVTCPVLIIHGIRDQLIPVDHAKKLYKTCEKSHIKSKLVIHPDMTHNELSIKEHVTLPIIKFINQLDLELLPVRLNLPDYVRRRPRTSDTISCPEAFGEELEAGDYKSEELKAEDVKLEL